ncbi:hypothetical protein AMELA_G00178120 [Ameiurus melas]|uniref:Secreted protein n=1 Tax=Ameiurus melas TaxID=219545 RepID=A0A7J6ABP5_AMEME|nr:hypothetical protein AMELA_G00178120 [Ameiurus melas]
MRCTVVLKAAGGHHILTVLLILTPLCSGTHYSISVPQTSVKCLQFMFQMLNVRIIRNTHYNIWKFENSVISHRFRH